MKLTFFGAAHAVTGSCHCVECGGKKILVDCGLQQGRDERDNQALDFNAGYIDAVVVTHAHIDHSGRIPLLVKQGFAGNIYCTRLTGQLLSIMLRDSAHIQESDAQWAEPEGQAGRGGAGGAPVHRGGRGGGRQARGHLRVRHHPPDRRRGEDPLCGRGPPAGLGQRGDVAHRGGRDPEGGLLRRHRQPGPAHHPGPPVHRGRRLRPHREHLRRPAPRHEPEAGLHRRPGRHHRRDPGPGGQRDHPLLRRGPHPGAALLHPGDEGAGPGEERAQLHRGGGLPPGRRGHPHLLRRSPRLPGRGGHRRPEGRAPCSSSPASPSPRAARSPRPSTPTRPPR